jgi:heme iron utilization protein
MPDPVQPATDEARALSRRLLTQGYAALAWEDPETQSPGISRISFARDPELGLLTLVSGLAAHTAALRARPDCALMLGEVAGKGDPLTYPRLMIRAVATFLSPDDPLRPSLRARWLTRNPKATVYIDLPDFSFVRLTPVSAFLNGGFGKAFTIAPQDL